MGVCMWWYVGKGASFEGSNGIGEGAGGGVTLSGAVFNADEDDILECGDSHGGVGYWFGRPFIVS